MPTVNNVKTKNARSVWQSPDGQREIFEVILDVAGKEFKASTYSKAIATEGWSGDIETWEKPGKGDYPAQTFVKQPQKAGGYGGGGGKGYDKDPFAMYLSYAKDVAIACIEVTAKGNKFNDTMYSEMLGAIEAGGAQLFASRNQDKPEAETTTDAPAASEASTDEVSVEDLSAALGGEPVNPGETPWPGTS